MGMSTFSGLQLINMILIELHIYFGSQILALTKNVAELLFSTFKEEEVVEDEEMPQDNTNLKETFTMADWVRHHLLILILMNQHRLKGSQSF